MLSVNLEQLITFYDQDEEARPHSNAIKTLAGEELGFALLIEYFRRNGKSANLRTPCNTGHRTGPRLDGWLQGRGGSGADIDYQVEVKSWSFHGVGGHSKPLAFDCPLEQLTEHKHRVWQHYWENGQFRPKELKKVLAKMERLPDSNAIIQPLACIWDAVHPKGESEPFFIEKTVACPDFQSVAVFSMSGFLRGLKEESLTLALPITSKRIEWIGRIFNSP